MSRSFHKYTCILLAGILSAGAPVFAGEPVEIRSSDVALNDGGILKGTILTTAANPLAGVKVNVLHENKVVATSISNEKGEFSVRGLRNGTHSIQVGKTRQSVRLWGTNSAPPAAVENVAIVVDDETVRGQGLPIADPGSYVAENAGAILLIGGAVAVTLATTLDNNTSGTAGPGAPASP